MFDAARYIKTVALTAALLACASADAQDPIGARASEPPRPGCAARTERLWVEPDQLEFFIEAHADGWSCANAVATLVLRDRNGETLWAGAFVAAHNFGLSDGATPEAMRDALSQWTQGARLRRTGMLPAWSEGASRPGGEFPFRPSEYFGDRESYEALRVADKPMFCFVSGRESLLCLVFNNERIEEVGRQSFPG